MRIFCSLGQGELGEACEEVERGKELCHGGGSLHQVRYRCYRGDLSKSVRLCGEVAERNHWRTSQFFVIVTDSSRKENPGFSLSCVLLHVAL